MFDLTVNGGFLPICIPKPLIYLTHMQRNCNSMPTLSVTLSLSLFFAQILNTQAKKRDALRGSHITAPEPPTVLT